MPLEPKKPIEELLETSAGARRAEFGADPKMPNPMRAQLHHEIARLARRDERKSRRRSFVLSWPGFVTATALTLVLVSASAIWWWREHQSAGGDTMKLAMQQPMAPAQEAVAPEKVFEQGAAAAATRPAESGNTGAVQSADQAKAADALSKFAEATTTPSPLAPMTKDFIGAAKKTDGSLPSDISLAAKEANQSAPAAASLGQDRQTINFRQQLSQNAADQAFRSKPKQTLNILNEFQVEQTEHEIRVVDADGSTYSGKLEPLAQNDARSIFNQKRNYAAPSSRAAASSDDKAQAANAEFYFRATGYNSSLKKRLVFEGNYIASPVGQKKMAKAKAEAEERDEQTPARITGTAKIRGESPVQIDAIAVAK
ncbi:MAG: hypothetical protein DMF19_04205 [Verrucomicrobia bacterium]|nr:MAG: hypothetical protein DMF19_04205 [Verrucomicrobiota bacterium]